MARLPITTITKTSTSEVVLNYLTAVNGTPAADQFRSTITGRSKMIDFSTDMLPRMGVERIQVQQIMRVDGEVGPAGEAVFKPVNDKFDQIRFVGGWSNQNDSSAPRAQSTVIGDFCEITFYGTGLNILCYSDATNRAMTISVDGGATVSIANQGSGILTSRNYAPNSIINLVSGLTLGLHTVKVSSVVTTLFIAYGFEILNESSSIKVGAGQVVANGVARTIAAHTSAYNSGFESGTLGTRGGRVLVYAKRDGTIGKAVTPTDAASLTLTSADHTNEEVIRNYFFREFGAGRTDDFSTLASTASARAFTLDDGTTTLVASSAISNINTYGSEGDSVRLATSAFMAITFVGTGLDVSMFAGGSVRDVDVSIDGAANVNLPLASGFAGIKKVVSGLPYGTHTVKFTQTSANNPGFQNFIVYGPKKPTLPTGAMELADYNIMADYVPVSAGDIQGSVARGVLRKHGIREAVYSGTWAATGLDATYEGGIYIAATANASYVEYTFWGTGFDLRCGSASNGDPASQLTLDGSTNFSAYTTSFYGTGINFTAATGVLDQLGSNTNGTGVSVRGLTLGKHVIRTTKTSGTFIYAFAIDVITPIHVHKNNGPFVLQNTLSVGSQGINDSRKFGSQLVISRNYNNVRGLQAVNSTTSTTLVPSAEMETSIKTSGGAIKATFTASIFTTGGVAVVYLALFIDGKEASTNIGGSGGIPHYTHTNSQDNMVTIHTLLPVAAGWHTVQVFFRTSAFTGYIENNKELTVEEIPNS